MSHHIQRSPEALTLLIAESDPKDEERIIGLVILLLSGEVGG